MILRALATLDVAAIQIIMSVLYPTSPFLQQMHFQTTAKTLVIIAPSTTEDPRNSHIDVVLATPQRQCVESIQPIFLDSVARVMDHRIFEGYEFLTDIFTFRLLPLDFQSTSQRTAV